MMNLGKVLTSRFRCQSLKLNIRTDRSGFSQYATEMPKRLFPARNCSLSNQKLTNVFQAIVFLAVQYILELLK